MKTARVIIGANFGDEGKGLMTDYFASLDPEHSVVLRFNGGAQAGHTVVTPDGRRHVFSHFGSASFLSCPTFLTKYFIVNPMLFAKELTLLQEKWVEPIIYADPRAIVSTPFDVFINQLVENRRAGNRHGSCGVGINETVIRCLRAPEYRTRVADLRSPNRLRKQLQSIAENWFPARLRELGIDPLLDELNAFLSKLDMILDRYLQDAATFLCRAEIRSTLPENCNVIFEGAQGLMLDEARIDLYPHLTRSRTGLHNVVELAREFAIDELKVTYVTRSYLTRHGAGPLSGEAEWKLRDDTNVPNLFQGTLRFAALDLAELHYSIMLDLKQARQRFPAIQADLAITCADQMPIPEPDELPLPLGYVVSGPSRINVKMIEKEFDILVKGELASAAVA